MRALLAERLLATVMKWTPDDVARERPILQALANLKYDDYQQFSPGMRFVESLALWLEQFKTLDEKLIAYNFIKDHLIFFSHEELSHFAETAYPDYIRPHLIDVIVKDQKIAYCNIENISQSDKFKDIQTNTFFFGLSDGARIDPFRRFNRDLTHEQIFQDYRLSNQKLMELVDRFVKIDGLAPIRALVLIDDFTASGISFIRKDNDISYTGKLIKFFEAIRNDTNWHKLVDLSKTLIIIVFYIATDYAINEIKTKLTDYLSNTCSNIIISVVQPISDDFRIRPGCGDKFTTLIESYYDSSLEDDHTRKGGTDLKYGFSECGLPVVLQHNSPNNSLFLLWAEEQSSIRSLFPRVSRHKGDI